MRKSEMRFADAFVDELHKAPNTLQAQLRAGRRMEWYNAGGHWCRPMSDKLILKRARHLLQRKSVVEYLEYIFDAVGFTPIDGARKLVEHITTSTEKDPLGSLDALKHYHALTTKKQAQKVEMDTRMLVAHKFVTAEPPKMRARVLKVSEADAALPGA